MAKFITKSNKIPESHHFNARGGSTGSDGRFLEFYERINIDPHRSDVRWVIPKGMENLPDEIANLWYGEPRFMWVIIHRNKIKDPLRDLFAGRVLRIPTPERLFGEILEQE